MIEVIHDRADPEDKSVIEILMGIVKGADGIQQQLLQIILELSVNHSNFHSLRLFTRLIGQM